MSEGAAIKAYFLLQYRMTNRKIRVLGIYPALGWVIGLVCFIGLTLFILFKQMHDSTNYRPIIKSR